MEQIKENFIKLLNSHLRQETINIEIFQEKLDWNIIYAYASKHDVIGMIYNASEYLPDIQKPNKEMQRKLRERFMVTVSRSIVQEIEMEMVIQKLNAVGVCHLLIKGYILKKLYPVPELRSMGDIDFLIKEKDRQKCHKVMLELGFTCTRDSGFVWCYQKGQALFEIHTNLMAGERWNSVDFETYYEKIWQYVECKGNFTYELRKEHHFIYLIAHAAKHFRYAGYGTRGIMDCALYLKHYGKGMDWSEIWRELKFLRLEKYALAIIELCICWFEVKEENVVKTENLQLSNDFRELFIEIILEGGVYGYCGRNLEQVQIRNQMTEMIKNHMGLIKMKTAIKLLFPGYRSMRGYMKTLEKYPFLLPVAWAIRWYQAIFKRGSKNIKRMKRFQAQPEGIIEEFELLKKLELF